MLDADFSAYQQLRDVVMAKHDCHSSYKLHKSVDGLVHYIRWCTCGDFEAPPTGWLFRKLFKVNCYRIREDGSLKFLGKHKYGECNENLTCESTN